MLLLDYTIQDSILTVSPNISVMQIIAFMGQVKQEIFVDEVGITTVIALKCLTVPVSFSKVGCEQNYEPQCNTGSVGRKLLRDCVLVMEKSQLFSIFTLEDVVCLVASGMNLVGVKIREVMREPVRTSIQDFDVSTIFSLMSQHGIRHIAIVDDQGSLLGIVTPESIAKGLHSEYLKTKDQLQQELAERSSLELVLKTTSEQLEKQITERTQELVKANKLLQRGICDRIVTEAQLLQTTSELQELFQAFPDKYFRLKKDGIILSYYAREISNFYLKSENILGKKMQDIWPLDIAKQFQQAILQVTYTNSLIAIEYSLSLTSGIKSFEARLFPSIPNQIIVIIRDITERKQAQEALQKAKNELEVRVEERTWELKNTNDRLRQEIVERKRIEQALRISEERCVRAINAGKVGIWEWNIQTNEIYIHPNLKGMLGYNNDEISQNFDDWLMFIHPHDIEAVKAEFNAYLKGLIPKYEIEHRMIHKDGYYIWFLARGILRHVNKKPCFMAGSNTDITARKQADNQIKSSLKEKEVLLKEIHHRVKNNLQIISSLLRLQSGYIKDEQAFDIFKDSQNRVRAMAMIHENLYQSHDLARIEFSEYIHNLSNNLMRCYGSQRNISINLNIDKALLRIDTAIPCGLIINELISNSMKHAFVNSEYGEIFVDFFMIRKGEYSLNVSDNGVGITSETNSNSPTNQSLGLELVRELVEQLEGKIIFNTNLGTSVQITFIEEN